MQKKKIRNSLRKALLENGPMSDGLYIYELAEHIDFWYDGLLTDQNEFVFVVTENSGHVAMALITPEKTVYKNEAAREELARRWPKTAYFENMRELIPMMADDLANDIISVNGINMI